MVAATPKGGYQNFKSEARENLINELGLNPDFFKICKKKETIVTFEIKTNSSTFRKDCFNSIADDITYCPNFYAAGRR